MSTPKHPTASTPSRDAAQAALDKALAREADLKQRLADKQKQASEASEEQRKIAPRVAESDDPDAEAQLDRLLAEEEITARDIKRLERITLPAAAAAVEEARKGLAQAEKAVVTERIQALYNEEILPRAKRADEAASTYCALLVELDALVNEGQSWGAYSSAKAQYLRPAGLATLDGLAAAMKPFVDALRHDNRFVQFVHAHAPTAQPLAEHWFSPTRWSDILDGRAYTPIAPPPAPLPPSIPPTRRRDPVSGIIASRDALQDPMAPFGNSPYRPVWTSDEDKHLIVTETSDDKPLPPTGENAP